ncbi:hypothetical protein MTsPCn3_18040 [Erythrobacter sp. MTPC3]
MGSLIGTSVPSIVAIAVAIGSLNEGDPFGLALAIMPFAVGLVIAGAGLLLIGIPTTAWLKRRRAERGSTYFWGGFLSGGLVTFAITYALFDGLWQAALLVAAFGSVTGGATGFFWWRYARRQAVETASEQIAEVFG